MLGCLVSYERMERGPSNTCLVFHDTLLAGNQGLILLSKLISRALSLIGLFNGRRQLSLSFFSLLLVFILQGSLTSCTSSFYRLTYTLDRRYSCGWFCGSFGDQSFSSIILISPVDNMSSVIAPCIPTRGTALCAAVNATSNNVSVVIIAIIAFRRMSLDFCEISMESGRHRLQRSMGFDKKRLL